ncbi:MAG TPA: hypothetical protein VHL57_08565 [Flavobacteriales bacterium]|jgi:hypothetical protein|nr:hypothetical protein [Flavobacteriales bacterium]
MSPISMSMRQALLVLAFYLTLPGNAQNVFPEVFKGCVTDHFALESDTATAKQDAIAFVALLKQELGDKTIAGLRGTLKFQIIVDLDGSSCLLSVENLTGRKTSKLKLKEFVDNKVKWDRPYQKVAALIVLEFTEQGIGYRRLGNNGKRGWHYLN